MKKALLILAATVTLVLSGCAKDKESSVIRIGVMPDVATMPYCLALENGYFKEEGIDVQIQYFKSAQDRESALQANQLDGISSDLVNLFLLKKNGMDYRALSTTYGMFKIVGNQDVSGIEGLSGKKIGLSTNTMMEYIVDSVLEEKGVPGVEKVNIPAIPARLEMINSNQIDAAIMPEPFATTAINAAQKELLDMTDTDLRSTIFLFSNEFAQSHKDELKKFSKAVDRAIDYINETDKSVYVDIITEKVGVQKEGLLATDLGTFPKPQLPDRANVERANAWLISKGNIDKTIPYEETILDLK